VVQITHYINLLYQTLLPLLLTIRRLLRKRLHRKVTAQLHLLRQIHRREVALPNFLLRFELLVEPPLVQPPLQHLPPTLHLALRP
jgi:hypothetical protein